MLDVRLFRIARFTAASASITVAFFSLFGFIFLVTQYFQFVKGYAPLSTGVRFLPVATSVGVASVLGTALAVRPGTKLVVTVGSLLVTGFYLWAATDSAATTYGVLAAQMIVSGVGLGLTSAPATESILGAVPADSAGVGSAVNDATRLLGGTLGVAVIGSLYASLYGHKLASGLTTGLPAGAVHAAHQSIGAAYAVAARLAAQDPQLAAHVRHVATASFIHGMRSGCVLAGGVALAGAVMAAVLLPAQPDRHDAHGGDGAERVDARQSQRLGPAPSAMGLTSDG